MKQETKCYCGHTTYCDCGPLEEPKQETLEEAAEKYLQEWRLVNNIHLSNVIHAERCKNDFIAGAKWQAEKILAFINDEDNHTEGELGNSCIDAQTLVNFIKTI